MFTWIVQRMGTKWEMELVKIKIKIIEDNFQVCKCVLLFPFWYLNRGSQILFVVYLSFP